MQMPAGIPARGSAPRAPPRLPRMAPPVQSSYNVSAGEVHRHEGDRELRGGPYIDPGTCLDLRRAVTKI
jgi:hypothetical protein